MKQYRWERRNRKQEAKRNRMKKSGRSVFVLQEQMKKKEKYKVIELRGSGREVFNTLQRLYGGDYTIAEDGKIEEINNKGEPA